LQEGKKRCIRIDVASDRLIRQQKLTKFLAEKLSVGPTSEVLNPSDSGLAYEQNVG